MLKTHSGKLAKMLQVMCCVGLLAAPSLASAGAVITSGNIALGVNNEGHLNTYSDTLATSNGSGGAVGIAYKFADGSWRDATSPGCLCEGWGVSANGVSGYAAIDNGGISNITVDSFTSSASSVTSSVHLTSSPAVSVTQAYAPAIEAPGALFRDRVTIKNNGTSTLSEVRYVRVMDWDVPPTEFNEYVTIQGTATTSALVRSHDNGFDIPDPLGFNSPLNGSTLNTDFVDNGPADHGAYFQFLFGDLAAGESKVFDIFYGAAGNEESMLSALGAVGIELYSLGQSNGGQRTGMPATYAFGFKGVGGEIILPPPPTQTPEPSTLLLVGAGLAGVVCWRKRRNS